MYPHPNSGFVEINATCNVAHDQHPEIRHPVSDNNIPHVSPTRVNFHFIEEWQYEKSNNVEFV